MRKSIIVTRIFTIFAIIGLLGGFAYQVFAAIPLGSNFQLNSQLPLDARSVATTITTRNAISSGSRYEGMVVYVIDSDGAGNPATYQLQNGITNSDWVEFGSGAGSGTVTSVSVSTANGVSGSVANNTTTPAITLTLGAITPSSVNGLTLTAGGTGFSIAGGTTSKTLTVSNTLTLAGTDSSTLNIGAGGTLGTGAFAALGATRALDNLASVAINTSLISDTDNTDALGSATIGWSDLFLGNGSVITWSTAPSTSDLTLTHSSNALTLAGGSLVLPNAGLTVGASVPFSDSSGTLTLQNVDVLDTTTEGTIEGAIDTLDNLNRIQTRTVLFGGDFSTAGAFTTAGAFALTLTSTATTNVTLPTSGTLYGTATGSITSSQLATSLTDETGSGLAVFDTTPTFTTNITAPLVIGGTGTTSTLTFKTTSGVGTTNADMIFQVGNDGATEAMRILNSGSIGIGTASPSSKLDITTNTLNQTQTTSSGLALVNTTAAVTNTQQVSPAIRWHGSGWRGATSAAVDFDFRSYVTPVKTTGISSTAYLGFGSSVAGGTYNDGQFIINSLGNVAVGTVTPVGLFQVTQPGIGPGVASTTASSTTVSGIHTNFLNSFRIGDTITINGETRTISAIAGNESMTTDAWTATNTDASYSVGNTGSRFIIKGNGFMGTNSTDITARLDIQENYGSGNGAGLGYVAKFFNDGNNADRLGLQVQAGEDSGTGTLIQFRDGDGTDVGEITFSGTTATYGTSSDRRMKDNIIDTRYTLQDLLNIQVRDYTFNTENSGRVYTGFIAQDLKNIYPDAVFAPDDGITANNPKMWSVDYGKITPLIVKSIQDLNLKIEGFKSLNPDEPESLGSLIKQFLADNILAIKELTASVLRINGEVCVDDVCVTKDQFKALLQSAGGTSNLVSPPADSGTGGGIDVGTGGDVTTGEDQSSGSTETPPSDVSGGSGTDIPPADGGSSTTDTPPADIPQAEPQI